MRRWENIIKMELKAIVYGRKLKQIILIQGSVLCLAVRKAITNLQIPVRSSIKLLEPELFF